MITYRDKCVDCKKPIPIPTWVRCDKCGMLNRIVLAKNRYVENQRLAKRKYMKKMRVLAKQKKEAFFKNN